MSADVVNWISCELSKLLGTDADDAVARHNAYFLIRSGYVPENILLPKDDSGKENTAETDSEKASALQEFFSSV